VTNPAADFKRLLEQRDQAAYYVVATVETVLRFCKVQDYERSLALLQGALTEFRCADIHLTEFHKSLKGDSQCHSNSQPKKSVM
jgi:hypothetical protein